MSLSHQSNRLQHAVPLLASALVVLLAAACARSSQPTQPPGGRSEQTIPVDEGFRLAYGKEGMVAGTDIRLRFDTLLEDSRCPTNVQCVWAGNARIVLRFQGAARAGEKRDTLNLSLEPRASEFGGFLIRFESLEPARTSEQQPELRSYVATLRVKPASG